MSRDIANDRRTEESEVMNVLVNEMALSSIGAQTPQDALNKRFYSLDEDATVKEYIVVGVVPTQNIVGLMNELKPWFYQYSPNSLRIASVRITGGNIMDSVESIEDVWNRVIPDYPIRAAFSTTFSMMSTTCSRR